MWNDLKIFEVNCVTNVSREKRSRIFVKGWKSNNDIKINITETEMNTELRS